MRDFILTALATMATSATVLAIALLLTAAPYLAEAHGVWAGIAAVVTALATMSLLVATVAHWLLR